MMEEVAGWIAPLATAIAAVMTAANLGAAVTGWGFVVFVVGSVAWSFVGFSTGQTNLLWTNGLLTVVNLIGVWRWLGRRARYQKDGRRAVAASAGAATTTMLTLSMIADMPVRASDGETVGTVVEGMMACDTGCLATIVVRRGGVAGIGERLIAVESDLLTLRRDHVALALNADGLDALPDWAPDTPPAGSPGARAGSAQNVTRTVAP